MFPLLLLLAYLWLTGGLGWAAAYEHSREEALTLFGKAVIVLFWPLFTLVSAVGETVDAVGGLYG